MKATKTHNWVTVKEDNYQNMVRKYNILAILLLLEEYEQKEMYEECFIIKSAIDRMNIERKGLYPPCPTSLQSYKNDEGFKQHLQNQGRHLDIKRAKSITAFIKMEISAYEQV